MAAICHPGSGACGGAAAPGELTIGQWSPVSPAAVALVLLYAACAQSRQQRGSLLLWSHCVLVTSVHWVTVIVVTLCPGH